MLKNKIVLIFLLTNISFAQYFYTNNKKIYLEPTFQNRSLLDGKSSFITKDTNEKMVVYNEIIFKIKDIKDLNNVKKEYGLGVLTLLKENTYKVKVDKNLVFDISNELYKDYRIKFAHPDVDMDIKQKVINNPLGKYAGFLNALHIKELWKIAPNRGLNVKVAVMDTAIDVSHIDLKDNLIEQYTPKNIVASSKDHGTSCIGIISASDNYEGSVGIAPKSKFYAMTLSYRLSEVIKSLDWLVDKDIGVLNNSWGVILYDALSDALENLALKGRGGKGTVITFASGNSNINYNINPVVEDQSELEFVLGVGATDTLGEKTSYSNYGDKIDIYAFGGDTLAGIMTTARNNSYTGNFGGTSASAPIVAGVVALMLSIDPDLRFKDIKSILQDTADISAEGYKSLNAKKALLKVKERLNGGIEEGTATTQDANAPILPPTSTQDNAQINNKQSSLMQVVSGLESISIKKGWNMLGTSFEIQTSEIKKRWDGVSIFVQNRRELSSIYYIEDPLVIKAGEGFWVYESLTR